MTIIDNEMLWRQFGAAIDMLSDTLRDCPDILWRLALSAGLHGLQVWLPSQDFGHCIDDPLRYLADDFSSVLPFPRLHSNHLCELSAWIRCGIWAHFLACY
jgi:hypothetical protein